MSYIRTRGRSDNLGDPPATAEARKEARLKRLAKWPARAHAAWKNLEAVDRNLVIWQMAANYGSDFARKYLDAVGKRKPNDMVDHYYGRGVGPTPAKVMTQGYKLAQKDSVHQWWVHPSGESVTRNYSDDKPGTATQPSAPAQPSAPTGPSAPTPAPRGKLPRPAICQQIDTLTDSICKNADAICRLAADLNDPKSRDTCERARASCETARGRSRSCS